MGIAEGANEIKNRAEKLIEDGYKLEDAFRVAANEVLSKVKYGGEYE